MKEMPEGSPAGPVEVKAELHYGDDASGPATGEGLAALLALVPRKLLLMIGAALAAALAHLAGLDDGLVRAVFETGSEQAVPAPIDRAHRPDLRLERADQEAIRDAR